MSFTFVEENCPKSTAPPPPAKNPPNSPYPTLPIVQSVTSVHALLCRFNFTEHLQEGEGGCRQTSAIIGRLCGEFPQHICITFI